MDNEKKNDKSPVPQENTFVNSHILLVDPSNRVKVSTVEIYSAPIMFLFINHQATEAIMDTGVETNIISDIRAHRLGLKIGLTQS